MSGGPEDFTAWQWAKRLVSGKPHFVIGAERGGPYLLRWYLIPRNHTFNLYLHKFLRSDEDRALHDHPWSFFSLLVKGEYAEYVPDGVNYRQAPSIAYRPARWRHRVSLTGFIREDETVGERPAWTIIATGRKKRLWGFWCPRERQLESFVPWNEWDTEAGCGDS